MVWERFFVVEHGPGHTVNTSVKAVTVIAATVNVPEVDEDLRAFGNEVSGVNIILDGIAKSCQQRNESRSVCEGSCEIRTQGHRRMPPQCFSHDGFYVGKVRAVGIRRQTVLSNDTVNFFLCFLLDIWM